MDGERTGPARREKLDVSSGEDLLGPEVLGRVGKYMSDDEGSRNVDGRFALMALVEDPDAEA
jgi:hypothetical protein